MKDKQFGLSEKARVHDGHQIFRYVLVKEYIKRGCKK
jgi:hypothetical protein